MRTFLKRRRVALLVCGLTVLAVTQWLRWQASPAVPLLVDRGGAAWIVRDQPFQLPLQPLGARQATFRKSLHVPEGGAPLLLEVQAFKLCAVLVDGALACEPRTALERWKEPVRVDLRPLLRPGRRELALHVYNHNGPPAVLAVCPALGLRTDEGWEASADGIAWSPARPASTLPRPQVAASFPTTAGALAANATFFAALLAAVAALSWRRGAGDPSQAGPRPLLTASGVRWMLLLAWAVLAANNVLKLPDRVGLEVPEHLAYIRYLSRWKSIPLATEGWQMFQSPLYYLLCAPLDALLQWLCVPPTGDRLLRLVSLACGAGQVQLSLVACRHVFPGREDLQVLGTLTGGLLPMNVYLSQTVGNEPLAGLLSAAVLVLALVLVQEPQRVRERRFLALGGLVLGLACLAKVTAVLLAPVLAGAIVVAARRSAGSLASCLRRAAGAGAQLGAVAALTCGWYYARNWIALGKPFIGGWDPARGIVWWQDPGYRTLHQLASFGESLVQPVYAATASFLDGLYSTFWTDGYLSAMTAFELRPPWNEGLMAATGAFAVVPTGAMLLGAARASGRSLGAARAPVALAAVAVAIHLTALLELFVRLPVYSTAKATYTLGLTPAYALLAAAGLDLLTRGRIPRALVHGLLACLAACAYGAYFIL